MKPAISCNTVFILLLILGGLTTTESVWAKSVYIADKIYVPIRRDRGNQFEILHKGLPTGTRLTLIERDGEWTKVTTKSGITGWLRSQYLSDSPPASTQLIAANRQLAALRKELQSVRDENASLKKNHDEVTKALEASELLIQETSEELRSIKTISAAAIESQQRLQSLAEKLQLLQTQNDVLTSENENLRRSERTTFFLYGALTLLLATFVAAMVPRLRSRKSNSGWSD